MPDSLSRAGLTSQRKSVGHAALKLHDALPNRLKKKAEGVLDASADSSAANLTGLATELLSIVSARRDEMLDSIVSSTGADRNQAARALEATPAGRTLQEVERELRDVNAVLAGAAEVLDNMVSKAKLERLRGVVAVQPASDQREELLAVIDEATASGANDRAYGLMLKALESLPHKEQEMMEKHEFAKNGHLPDTYYDRFGNVRAEMVGRAQEHLAKTLGPQPAHDRGETSAEREYYGKVEAMTSEGISFEAASAQVNAQEPELAKRVFG
ncbi:MAG: hypothetical protein AAF941_09470 [Pseudomonadota bacterium]